MLWIILALLALVSLFGFLVYHNGNIGTTELAYPAARVPEGLLGLRFVQVSDLHNNEFGKDQTRLLRAVRDAKPAYILLTGDMIDRKPMRHTLTFVRGAVKIAPVYYVSGNHEYRHGVYDVFREALIAAGVTVLDNQVEILQHGGAEFALIGMMDPDFFETEGDFINTLNRLSAEAGDRLKILLSHRPEWVLEYAHAGIDLAFTGHVHGGGVRIPGLGAIYAPNQGLMPKYFEGMYWVEDTALVVSRGLGNSVIPNRVNDAPELVALTLGREKPTP